MKTISIEKLLTWAFTLELPKVGQRSVAVPGFSASDLMAQVAELGTIVDSTPNPFGVVSGFVWEGEPHPDAITVGNAVKALADLGGWEIGEGWRPFPEWADEHGLIAPEVARIVAAEAGRGGRLNGRHVTNLVTTCAVLKRGPDWQADEPKVAMVTKSGKPAWFIRERRVDKLSGKVVTVEDEGFDARRQRPKPGAFRKYRLTSSIRGAVIDRLEWQLWQSALETLAKDLDGRLESHVIAPFVPDRSPWARRRVSVSLAQ